MSVWESETEALLERNQESAQPIASLWGESVMEGEELAGWLDEQRARQAREKADAVLKSEDEDTQAVVTKYISEKSSAAVQRTANTHKNLLFLVVCILIVVVTAVSLALLAHFTPPNKENVVRSTDSHSEFIVGDASLSP